MSKLKDRNRNYGLVDYDKFDKMLGRNIVPKHLFEPSPAVKMIEEWKSKPPSIYENEAMKQFRETMESPKFPIQDIIGDKKFPVHGILESTKFPVHDILESTKFPVQSILETTKPGLMIDDTVKENMAMIGASAQRMLEPVYKQLELTSNIWNETFKAVTVPDVLDGYREFIGKIRFAFDIEDFEDIGHEVEEDVDELETTLKNILDRHGLDSKLLEVYKKGFFVDSEVATIAMKNFEESSETVIDPNNAINQICSTFSPLDYMDKINRLNIVHSKDKLQKIVDRIEDKEFLIVSIPLLFNILDSSMTEFINNLDTKWKLDYSKTQISDRLTGVNAFSKEADFKKSDVSLYLNIINLHFCTRTRQTLYMDKIINRHIVTHKVGEGKEWEYEDAIKILHLISGLSIIEEYDDLYEEIMEEFNKQLEEQKVQQQLKKERKKQERIRKKSAKKETTKP